jgi:hypothetical protein
MLIRRAFFDRGFSGGRERTFAFIVQPLKIRSGPGSTVARIAVR